MVTNLYKFSFICTFFILIKCRNVKMSFKVKQISTKDFKIIFILFTITKTSLVRGQPLRNCVFF